jgi:hypothetical protein
VRPLAGLLVLGFLFLLTFIALGLSYLGGAFRDPATRQAAVYRGANVMLALPPAEVARSQTTRTTPVKGLDSLEAVLQQGLFLSPAGAASHRAATRTVGLQRRGGRARRRGTSR